MTTSGNSDFNPIGNDIIRAAALKVNAIRAGGTMSTQAIADWRFSLNAMVKHWQADELHIWTVQRGVLITQASTVRYALSDAATSAHACNEDDFVHTAVTSDTASGATTIPVDNTGDIAAADKICIVLDDGTIQFSTVVSKTSSTVTIAAALTDSVAAGAYIYAYTNRIVRPLRIVSARSFDPASGNEIPLMKLSRQEYDDLPNKTATGAINSYYYDRQMSAGVLSLWQSQVAASDIVKFTWHRPLEDFDAGGNTADMPQEWILTLIWNLAREKLPEYPAVPDRTAQMIIGESSRLLDDMKGFDRDDASVYFGVDMEG